jgi:hypothetical protein
MYSIEDLLFLPKGGVGQTQAWMSTYVSILRIPQMIYEFGERRWNVIDRGKPKNSDKNLSQCHFDHQKSHMDGANPGLRGERPATDDLSHGTARKSTYEPTRRHGPEKKQNCLSHFYIYQQFLKIVYYLNRKLRNLK